MPIFRPEEPMSLHSDLPTQRHKLGDCELVWDADRNVLELYVSGHVIWDTVPGEPFICASLGASDVEESRGFFSIKDDKLPYTSAQSIESFEVDGEGVKLSGQLSGSVQVPWSLTIRQIDDAQISLTAQVSLPDGEPRLLLRYASTSDEQFFGFGEQFTHLNLKGRRLDIISQEPGIGRGVQPLSWFMNTFFGAGGGETSSNAPAPHYITSRCRSLALENHELSRFDLREEDRIEVELWSNTMCARVFIGSNPKTLIEAYTRLSGRMPMLPSWIQSGAVIGMQGGTEAVRSMAKRLQDAGAPVAAFWLQDWVGARRTSVGSQLWWNWELDAERYPDWEKLRGELEANGSRVMSYINPFLVDVAERETAPKRNLYQEALEKGFLVTRQDGSPYLVQNTSFSAAMIDLTHPEARTWLKEVIKKQVIGAGVSGWMADFGEALPFDAKLYDGSDAAIFHNAYPEAWAQLNREAIEEAGLGGEVVFFARSGFTRSPGQSTLFWLGDQLTSWTAEDGIRSAVTGLLSSGFSGFSLNHSDIGGYTTTAIPGFPLKIPLLDFRRSRELLWRWIELNAFTAVFRTHEGNQPDRNTQIDTDPEMIAHFARFARVYAALAPVRERLNRESTEQGLPVVRHPWLSFPEDPETSKLRWQFNLGPLMVAPVLDPGASEVQIYLPAGQWQHLWSYAVVDSAGGWYEVAAPMGTPAVFFPKDDADMADLVDQLNRNGDRTEALNLPAPRLVVPQPRGGVL